MKNPCACSARGSAGGGELEKDNRYTDGTIRSGSFAKLATYNCWKRAETFAGESLTAATAARSKGLATVEKVKSSGSMLE